MFPNKVLSAIIGVYLLMAEAGEAVVIPSSQRAAWNYPHPPPAIKHQPTQEQPLAFPTNQPTTATLPQWEKAAGWQKGNGKSLTTYRRIVEETIQLAQ